MFINEYGSRDDPAIILLAPMMVSGSDLYLLTISNGDGTCDYWVVGDKVKEARQA